MIVVLVVVVVMGGYPVWSEVEFGVFRWGGARVSPRASCILRREGWCARPGLLRWSAGPLGGRAPRLGCCSRCRSPWLGRWAGCRCPTSRSPAVGEEKGDVRWRVSKGGVRQEAASLNHRGESGTGRIFTRFWFSQQIYLTGYKGNWLASPKYFSHLWCRGLVKLSPGS